MGNKETGINTLREDKKDMILKTASGLFAEKGFSSVGIRDIAGKAGVNISMISYYFGGKTGILKEILSDFLDKYSNLITSAIDESEDTFVFIENLVARIVPFFRQNTEAVLIFVTELPVDSSDITEFKAEKIRGFVQFLEKILAKSKIPLDEKYLPGIIGPVFFSVIFSHFLFKPVVSKTFNMDFNEDFYIRYTQIIKTILTGMLRELQTSFKNKEL